MLTCAGCSTSNLLRAHRIDLLDGRFQAGHDANGPYLRLIHQRPVRLRLPPGTTTFGLTLDPRLHDEDTCTLALAADLDSTTPPTSLFPADARLRFASITRRDPSLDIVEVALRCATYREISASVSIRELWLDPAHEPHWRLFVEEKLTDVTALPRPTVANAHGLFWQPSLPLAPGADANPAELAAAVLRHRWLRERLGLTDRDSLALESETPDTVHFKRWYRWRDRDLPVLDAHVRVELEKGYRLRSVRGFTGVPVDIPRRRPISPQAARAALTRTGRAVSADVTPPLVVRWSRLQYEFLQHCRHVYVDAYNSEVTAGPTHCIR